MPQGNMTLDVNITKNDSKLEGPYKFNIKFTSNGETFTLPNIVFGITGHKAHVYTIQGKRNRDNSALAKKLDRYFRKFGKNIDEKDIEGEVSTNALAAITIFSSYMKNQGIAEIEAPVYLPLRYKTAEILQKERLDADQFNITNRFAYTLLRYATHFEDSDFYYDESSQKCYLKINDNIHQHDDNEIYNFEGKIKKGLR